jgi:DNA ligase-1
MTEWKEFLQHHLDLFVDFESHFAKSSFGHRKDEAFLDKSIKDGWEGLIVKILEREASYYEPRS